MNAQLQAHIVERISYLTGSECSSHTSSRAHGGDINESWILDGSGECYFVKVNSAERLPMFTAELEALEAIQVTSTIRTPKVLTSGMHGAFAYLVLEYLQLVRPTTGEHWQTMGQQLAQMHRSRSTHFGWHRDNTIGSTPQINTPAEVWSEFFREHRLRPQFELLANKGHHLSHADALLDRIDRILFGHAPVPSLLHGDLWSGNAGFLGCGTPVIYDPATYYGDRETDMAFTRFFGGFHESFYRAYDEEWPLPAGFQNRQTLYNLYHALNHANLFGGSYIEQSESMIQRLINTF